MRASRLEPLPAAAADGLVRARVRTRRRSRPHFMAGLTALGLGVILVAAGAGVAATPERCGPDFLCGLDRAIDAVTVMGCGGGVGLTGIALTAYGGSSTSPTIPAGEPGIVYLSR